MPRGLVITLAVIGTPLLGAAAAFGVLYATGEGNLAGDETSTANSSTTTTTVTTSTDEPTLEEAATSTELPPDEPSGGLSLRRAERIVDREGYDVLSTDSWAPENELKVLIGLDSEAATGTAQNAFFFAGDEYIGTDTSDVSASIDVAYQDGTEVGLSYALYKAKDPNCCPTAGSATVRYRWNGESLEPQDEIPTADPFASNSRR